MPESSGDLRGRVLDVDALITCQEGAVVSRTLLQKKAGTITLFAFAAGEGLSEHTAPFDALVSILDGEAEVTIGGEAHRVGAGQMIIMPAGVPHALHAPKPFRMLLAMIREA
jgi:quercetin dioxygenase-like cupin family protein